MSAGTCNLVRSHYYCALCGARNDLKLEGVARIYQDGFDNPCPELIRKVAGPYFWKNAIPSLHLKDLPPFPEDIRERIQKFDEDVRRAGDVCCDAGYSLLLRIKNVDLDTLVKIEMAQVDPERSTEGWEAYGHTSFKEFEWVIITNNSLRGTHGLTFSEKNAILEAHQFEFPKLMDIAALAMTVIYDYGTAIACGTDLYLAEDVRGQCLVSSEKILTIRADFVNSRLAGVVALRKL